MVDLPKITLAQFDAFIQQLKMHDWYYDYSDDHRVWLAGRESAKQIKAIADSHPLYYKAYEAYGMANYAGPHKTFEEKAKERDEIIHQIRQQLKGDEA